MDETEVIRVLASADRQLLLHELVRMDGKTTEEELSRRVAAGRHQISLETVSEEKIDCAHFRLTHVHLPLLLDLNIIEWNEGKLALTDDEHRNQLLETAEALEAWPPDNRLRHHPS